MGVFWGFKGFGVLGFSGLECLCVWFQGLRCGCFLGFKGLGFLGFRGLGCGCFCCFKSFGV